MFKSAEEAAGWLMSLRNTHHSLDYFKDYLAGKGNPQYRVPCIHVAGTNGKGSTVNFLADMLMKEGYKVGTFTSPHLIQHQDRICVNHEWMEDELFLKWINENQAEWESEQLSMFEIDMLLAVWYFEAKQCDYAIYEVGLGGRLDFTNVLKPLAAVITSIGLDHTERLGDTAEKIAYEKAGIAKAGTLLISNEHKPGCTAVIQQVCENVKADYVETELPVILEAGRFSYRGSEYRIPSLAEYQISNACCALEVMQELKDRGLITINEESLKEGLAVSEWKGRFEIISSGSPCIILDGAHNADGIQQLVRSFKNCPRPITVVFAVLKDKNFNEMAAQLKEQADNVIFTEFKNDRVLHAKDWDELSSERYEDYHDAIQKALSSHSKTIVITGSLYFISEVRQEWQKETLFSS